MTGYTCKVHACVHVAPAASPAQRCRRALQQPGVASRRSFAACSSSRLLLPAESALRKGAGKRRGIYNRTNERREPRNTEDAAARFCALATTPAARRRACRLRRPAAAPKRKAPPPTERASVACRSRRSFAVRSCREKCRDTRCRCRGNFRY